MRSRLNILAHPDLLAPMMAFSEAVEKQGLEKSLMELVKVRASQINGCAFCLHMHMKDARAAGETEERVLMLSAWRESPLFTDRERAALAWTEALTTLGGPDEAAYEAIKAQFTEDEQMKLSLVIGMINIWNRLNVGFRTVPAGRAPGLAA